MGVTNNLSDIIKRQKELLSALETERTSLEQNDLLNENAQLITSCELLNADNEQLRAGNKRLSDENKNLKNALYEHFYNEKIQIANTVKNKIDIYFASNTEPGLNRLTLLENNIKARIDSVRDSLEKNRADIKDDIYRKTNELAEALDKRLAEARVLPPEAFTRGEREEFEKLKEEQLTGEQINSLAKKNNIEKFVGLNVVNAAGVLLLIIGAVALARFTYVRLPDLLKGAVLFLFGAALLAAGEWLNRKERNVFSLGLSAGGVGILFTALAAGFFGLRILGMYPAVVLCVLITAGAFLLATRYNSQIIAAFAIIGGYLPVFALNQAAVLAYAAMLYFIVLNLFALFISSGRKWRVSSFIGMFLNIAGTVYIYLLFYRSTEFLPQILTICYALFAFAVYMCVPVAGALKTRGGFKPPDVVMLAVNTCVMSLVLYWIFDGFGLKYLHGPLAAAFAAVYLLIGMYIDKQFPKDERLAKILFYLTGLAFVVLVVPLQFGAVWLSLGWLAEGVLMTVYGVTRDEKRLKNAGLAVCLLCLFAFIYYDLQDSGHYLFVYKYTAITAGGALILGAHVRACVVSGDFVKYFKYTVFINTWLYAMYLLLSKLRLTILPTTNGVIPLYNGNYYSEFVVKTVFQTDYLVAAAAIILTFCFAYAYARVAYFNDRGLKALSAALYIIGVLALFFINTFMSPVRREYFYTVTPSLSVTVVGTAVLLVIGVLSVLAVADLARMAVAEGRLGAEWFPIAVSGFLLIILTQNLIAQYNLAFSSAVISVLYALAALAWIVFGFTRRYAFMRRFGLGLAVLSVVKLFVIDLYNLTQGYRITSFFILGFALITISFVYQYFNKRLELKAGLIIEPESDK